ncbi:MAG: hypothetical protein NC184_04120 [Roseburia sp.]|nr:hypothetical protein [Roseburia sp.]
MAKDIEKIIEDSYVPEMEYVKTKRSDAPPEVPEVVLPKTKAEMYEEAKDRLEQKTSAVSKTRAGAKPKTTTKDRTKQATVEPKQRTKTKTDLKPEVKTVAITREKHGNVLHRLSDDPKWVGSEDELIPFAWRKPLTEVAHPSKYYKQTVRDEKARAQLLPVPREK